MTKFPDPQDTIPTRRSLIERLKNWGDDCSWQDFFNTYWRLIYGFARQAGLTEAEAQDVVQETILSVAKKMADFKNDPAFGSFKNWLLKITQRRIADQFRKRRARLELSRAEPEDRDSTPVLDRIADPAGAVLEELWQSEWEHNLVELALEKVKHQVSSKQFLFFYQQTFKQWAPRKVADKYGASIAQVYMAKYRVSAVFRRELTRLKKQLY
ncbi:MAG TPA: sigma-70 family RNA polymerase sigma factor [Patescibacteria group bacterium]|nr:sigma-70 family RNA polymerase sigma factor [Patescibacteria group bacterium]